MDAHSTMKRPVLTIAKYTCIEAARNRIFALLLVGIIGIFALGEFIGELAIAETSSTQAAILAFILRITAVIITALYVVSSVLREFNDKTINLFIALPVPRHTYYFGKLAGFCLLSVIITLVASLPIWIYAEPSQVVLWQVGLLFELLIVVAVCLFFIFTLENMPVAVTSVIAFYLLSRTISTMILIGQSPILESTDLSQKFINFFLHLIAFALPALDRFTRTDWLVYGNGSVSDLAFMAVQSVIYLFLLGAAALFDLYRKNF